MVKNPLDPDNNFEVQNEEMEAALKQVGKFIEQQLPEGVHFSLFLFSGKTTFYTSNVDRTSFIANLKQWLGRQERRSMFKKP